MTNNREEIGKRLRYQVVKMSVGSITAPEVRTCLSLCLSLLAPLGDEITAQDRNELGALEQRAALSIGTALTDTERRDIVGTCRQVVNRISIRLATGAGEGPRTDKAPASENAPPPVRVMKGEPVAASMPPREERKAGRSLDAKLARMEFSVETRGEVRMNAKMDSTDDAPLLKTENQALEEKLVAAYATILSQEKLLTAAAAEHKRLKEEIKRRQSTPVAAPSEPPLPLSSLAALEMRLASMEQEVARLLSQPDPLATVSIPIPEAVVDTAPPPTLGPTAETVPPKPSRRTPDEVLLDRLDKRLRNGQGSTP